MASVPWINPRKPLPPWLTRPERPDATKHQKRARQYYLDLYNATPLWADRKSIAAIYAEAGRRRKLGDDVEVDHIIPIRGHDVCGLHCAENLEIKSRIANQHKGNRYYPGMHYETKDLFEQPEQFGLAV